MRKRTLLFICLIVIMLLAAYVRPAHAHDCSSAADCANVIRGTGWLAALLGLLVGLAAAAARKTMETSNPDPQATIQIRPHRDMGTQHIEPDISTLPKSDLRLRPVLDPGEQRIEVENP